MRIQRANQILDVDDSLREYYLDDGWNILNEDGTIADEAIPVDVNLLRTMVKNLRKEVAALKEVKRKRQTAKDK